MLEELDFYKKIQDEIETFKQVTGNDTLWFRGEKKPYPSMKSSLTRELTENPDPIEKLTNRLSHGQHSNAINFENWVYPEIFKRTTIHYPDNTTTTL
ncbi:hypothetical protein [Paenibacillus sp. OK003]|uniref:hypothetical protein n=1 Tax=Paenibacillus sp. OK003 TaxID=1884380 RepID=UPI0008C15E02|nr:hypothetical protein [Paenibacillus sp. OK003]SEL31772.1 hypothetical protein SAMN05518856_109275 [Paenibacillus sp. OK003]